MFGVPATWSCVGWGLPPHYSNFSAPIYSLENTFPLVKLGQADKWQPDPANEKSRLLQRTIWLRNIAGWFLTTLFVAAVSGSCRRISHLAAVHSARNDGHSIGVESANIWPDRSASIRPRKNALG